MIFNEQGLIDLDELLSREASFLTIMEDGVVTEDELREQAQKVLNLLHEVECRLKRDELLLVERLIAEINVLSAIYHYYELQNMK